MSKKLKQNTIAEPVKPIGYYGCSCHPYNNWAECKKAHQKKLKIGQWVSRRCTWFLGVNDPVHTRGRVIRVVEEGNFYIVEYGNRPCDQHLEHAASLEIISSQISLF